MPMRASGTPLPVLEYPPHAQPSFRDQSSLLTEDEGRNWSNAPDVCIGSRPMWRESSGLYCWHVLPERRRRPRYVLLAPGHGGMNIWI